MNPPIPHRPETVVSLHPYFKVHEGKLAAFRELIERFIHAHQGRLSPNWDGTFAAWVERGRAVC